MTNPPIAPADLERLISPSRFGTYLAVTATPAEAVALYEWNGRVSGSFAEMLGHLEVLVRNAMHDHLTAHHATIAGRPAGACWFEGPNWTQHHWFTQQAQDSITKAVRDAGHDRQHSPRPGKVVAELTFGFWRYLASDRYEQSLWTPAIDGAFAAPGATIRARRRAVEDRLAPLHLLRNRIAHCEPVFGPISYRPRRRPPVAKHLADLHADALELAGWISPVAGTWLAGLLAQLPHLIAARP